MSLRRTISTLTFTIKVDPDQLSITATDTEQVRTEIPPCRRHLSFQNDVQTLLFDADYSQLQEVLHFPTPLETPAEVTLDKILRRNPTRKFAPRKMENRRKWWQPEATMMSPGDDRPTPKVHKRPQRPRWDW